MARGQTRQSVTGFGVVLALACALAAVLMARRERDPASSAPSAEPHQGTEHSSSGTPAPGAAVVGSSSSRLPEASAAPGASSAAPLRATGSATASSPASPGPPCPVGMIHVEGALCPFVAHRCAQYLGFDPYAGDGAESRDERRRCAVYRDDLICEGRPAELSFCIDRFEYPNMSGVKPATMISYREARQACRVEGKRLCDAEEWSFACEGARTMPYPYGIERDATACNIDRRTPRPNARALDNARDVSIEVGRLDQRVSSGSMSRCSSAFGVADLTGNVAEWVRHARAADEQTHESALIGGSWERDSSTCRGIDASHGADHRSHISGFRCCADPLDGRKARRLLPSGAELPRRRRIVHQ